MSVRVEERRRLNSASKSDNVINDEVMNLGDKIDTVDKGTSVFSFGVALALSYSATYFWRYPVFVLPLDTLEQTVVTIGSNAVDLQTCYSLALTIGFGLAKFPAVSIMSSSFFFRNRLSFIMCTLWVSCFFMAFGTLVFSTANLLHWQVIFLFLSYFFSSWIYGAMLSYIEGRMGTEALLSTMNFFYIYAGNASRGTGQLLLHSGLSPQTMPAVAGLVFCVLSSILLWYAAKIPPPSAYDMRHRSKRVAMSSEQRNAFLCDNLLGIACMILPYALLSLIRSFRDFYSQQIFSATVGKDDVPNYMFFTVDIPGALLACAIQYQFHKLHKNSVAYVLMLSTMVASVSLMLLCTFLFDISGRHVTVGYVWQIFVGIGIYVAYSILGAAAWDRLFGLLRTEGTCTFIVFLGDCMGYLGTTSLLLFKIFGHKSEDDDADDSSDDDGYLDLFISVVYVGSVVIILSLTLSASYFVGKSGTFEEVRHLVDYFRCG